MRNKILILGGYGNFGSRIAQALAKDEIEIIIAGRNKKKAEILREKILAKYPQSKLEIAIFDVNLQLENYLLKLQPVAIINTCGPFQNSDYNVAKTCIKCGVNYIDLSDGRDFVNEILVLDEEARKNNVSVISGASTVPALSSAVLEKYKNEFAKIDSLKFGISPGAKASRGLATTKAILSYLGKPLKPFHGSKNKIYD
mgnify:CR=1 FL=1